MNVLKNKPTLRQIRAGERRRQILDIALSLFAQKGYANTSIKDLADAAGISTGLIYHYFSGKEKLFEAAVEHNSFVPQLREILKDTKGQQCHEVLRNITQRFVNLFELNNMILKIFLREGSSNRKVQRIWSNLANNGISLLREYVAACIERGELRVHSAEITARCLFSSLLMFHFTKDIFKSSRITRSQFNDELLDILFQGIRNTEQ